MKAKNPKKMISYVCLSLCFLLVPTSCKKPAEAPEFEIAIDEGWFIRSSEGFTETGESLSNPGYDVQNWYPSSAPRTVLATLIENGVYTDPFFGKNLENIPTEQFKQPWWYRKEFMLADKKSVASARLVFEGINYSANIWLNGKKIASADKISGAFRMFDIDVTEAVAQGMNALAVEVFPPKPGDFTIGFVDWNPRPPDENMGIWREVKLRMSGPVSINHPFVHTELNPETLTEARLTVSADLINHSDTNVSGILRGEIEDISFSQPFSLEPGEKRPITIEPDKHSALILPNPRLWWPNNLGEPNLYRLKLKAIVNDRESDEQSTRFGIRSVSDYINEEGHRGYKINGEKVLIRGGGWVDDLFLVEEPRKIEAQFEYAKHMNLNAIRLEGFWGSSQTLYDMADLYGILLMPGWSCHWEWEGYLGKPVDEFGGIKTPEEMELISRSLRDQVLWLRNHPSIFVWVLGSDMLPRPELEKKYKILLDDIDPTRPTLSACGYSVSEVSGPTAVKMNGPYDYVTPNYWYVDKKHGGAYGFNTETGPGPQPPPLESLKKMIPKDHLWPIDDVWDFHCGRNEFNTLERYLNALHHRYWEPGSVEEFARLAQAANYEAIRAMFEAFSVNKHNTTGLIQWMYNSAWPEMYWQLFDYYLMPNGAFYGTKTGSEPLNIVYNYGDKDIYIVNDTLRAQEGLKAEVRVLNIDGHVLFAKDTPVEIAKNVSIKILEMPPIKGLSTAYFIDLKLKDPSGNILSRNFYWLSTQEDILDEKNTLWFVTPNKSFADFSKLKDLPPVQIEAKHQFIDRGVEQEIHVELENPSDAIAFFIELNVYGKESGHSVLPIFWDDNYISLLPGEIREIRARFTKEDLHGESPAFRFNGWNVPGD
ncbi:MAG: glycoside hydrolase family 2 TIM barrel-domain containing protein [Candidatus Aminicenantes bacterium]|jgi:exo-1,4-beta-D-glucosaminidase